MLSIGIQVDEALLRNVQRYADDHGTTLGARLAEHPALLAARMSMHLTIGEQTYEAYRPPKEVVSRGRLGNLQ